jgi:hypothetical protein
MQALTSKPVVEDFDPEQSGQGKEADTAQQRGSAASLLSSLSSPNTGAGGVPSVMGASDMAALMQEAQQQPDPNRQPQKMDFLRGSKGGGSFTAQGYSENLPIPQQFPYELKAGTIIINSRKVNLRIAQEA